MTRYARQITVAELGLAGHARLRAARVLVVGAGGLAAPVLQYLAGAGVGAIRLADPDRVAVSNLHRQTLFRMTDIGQPKVQAAAATLAALNPDCPVEPVAGSLRPGNAAALAAGVDLVLDCADTFAASYILSDLCAERGLPLVSASALGVTGYAGAFCGGGPSLRAVFPDLPQQAGSCAEDGVLGPVVGLIGTLQAQMALAILAGIAPSPLGRIITWDARALRFGGFSFAGATEPGWHPRFIDPDAIAADDFVADLRGADEGPLPVAHARRLTTDTLVATPPAPGQRAVLCCRSGLRSWRAAARLAAVWDGEITLVALGDPTGEPA